VTILDAQGRTHTLNRYNAMWDKPRPEASIMVCVWFVNNSGITEMELKTITLGNSCHRTRHLLPNSRLFQKNSSFTVSWHQLLNQDGISALDG